MRNEENFFYQLCLDKLNHKLNEEEESKFDELIIKSKDAEKKYFEIKKVWNYTSSLSYLPDVSVESEWVRFQNKKYPLWFSFYSFISNKFYIKIGIQLFALLLIFSLFLLFYFDNKENIIFLSSHNGEIKNYLLPDSTLIILNSGSSLHFDKNKFNEKREVYLEGEAFFDVIHEHGNFLVYTSEAYTNVIGTRFNVRSWNNETKVVVQEGKVLVSKKDFSHDKLILTRNEMIRISENKMEKKTVDSDFIIGWTKGRLIFDHADFDEIIYEITRFYDVQIKTDSGDYSSLSITGSFENIPVDSLLNVLSGSFNFLYEKQDSSYYLFQDDLK